MIGKIIKYYAIARAPKLAYSVTHPKNAARLAKTGWDLKHAWAPRVAGAAAVAVALPLGYMIGRMSVPRSRPMVQPMDESMAPDQSQARTRSPGNTRVGEAFKAVAQVRSRTSESSNVRLS